MFYSYYGSMIVLIPAMIFTMIVQVNIKRIYGYYSKVKNTNGITGMEAAREMLTRSGLAHLEINRLDVGGLTDYFDPQTNSINLSNEIYDGKSVAAIAIACHEVGHAVQYATSYAPIRVRNSIVPIVNLTASISWPLIFLGLFLSSTSDVGSMLFNIGTLCFAMVCVFHLITLPVELDASRRAINSMEKYGIAAGHDIGGSKKVLHAAAMTYVAALATSVMSLIRILLIRGMSRR